MQREVIRKEGNEIVLYTSDGSRVLGRFPFGAGQDYATEDDARAAAAERERQVQYFKTQAAIGAALVCLAEQGDVSNLVKTWKSWAGSFEGCVRNLRGKPGIDNPEALCAWLEHESTGKWPAEDAAREAFVAWILETDNEATTSLRAAIPSDPDAARAVVEAFVVLHAHLKEAANAADYLEAMIHRSFTTAADKMLAHGVVNKEERIALSGAIGTALDTFSQIVDEQYPDMRTRDTGALLGLGTLALDDPGPAVDGEPGPEPESTHTHESQRRTVNETLTRRLTETEVDSEGRLSGVVVQEGRSLNGNVYTAEALKSGIAIFANKPIFLNHPTRTEESERPEGDVKEKVGYLPDESGLFVGEARDGTPALRFKGGFVTAEPAWIRTRIGEGIMGDMSLRADAEGYTDEAGDFVVEAFVEATSLDFVTAGAAGGAGILESDRSKNNKEADGLLQSLTLEQLAEARPDIVNDLAKRERTKAYGEKALLETLKGKVTAMKKTNDKLAEFAAAQAKEARTLRVDQIIDRHIKHLPESAQRTVKQIIESKRAALIEAVKAPVLKLPKEVLDLPENVQALWVESFLDELKSKTSDAATHIAWAAIHSKFEQTDEGWKPRGAAEGDSEAGEADTDEAGAGEAEPDETDLLTSFEAQVKQAAETVSQLIGEAAGDGVTDLNSAPTETQEAATTEALVEAFKSLNYTEEQARSMAQGREVRAF